MTQYNNLNVNLSNSQLDDKISNKITKSATKIPTYKLSNLPKLT